MANQIKLTVGGINYTATISTTMVAIIAALEASDELHKAKAETARLKKELEKKAFPGQQRIRFEDK